MAGIVCPHCKTADNYASTQGGAGKGDDKWLRHKKCKVCGAVFSTIEIPVGLIKAGAPQAEVAALEEQAVAETPAVGPVRPATPVNTVPQAHNTVVETDVIAGQAPVSIFAPQQ